MSADIPPPGTPESITLEFERADELRNPDRRRDLVRTVVAMRNARGGSIWVGALEDAGGLTGIDPLGPEDRPLLDALRDQLIDLVEPMLALDHDVVLRPVDVHVPGGWMLEVRVKRGRSATPHCLLSGRSREFLTRSGSRNAVLPYDKIVRSPSQQGTSIRELTQERHLRWGKRFESAPGVAFSAAPDPDGPSDSVLEQVPESAFDLLRSPPLDRIRRRGWTWFSEANPAKRHRGSVRAGKPRYEEPYRYFELQPDGMLQFFTAMRHLSAQPNPLAEGIDFELPVQGQIDPCALVETVASLLRIHSALLRTEEYQALEGVGLILSFENASGWVMCREAPEEWMFASGRADWFQVPEDPTSTRVLLRRAATIRESPDLVSYQLLTSLLGGEGEGKELPWFEGGPDSPTFVPPR